MTWEQALEFMIILTVILEDEETCTDRIQKLVKASRGIS